jgi:hypothetical protein
VRPQGWVPAQYQDNQRSLQIGSDDLNNVVRSFLGRLGITRHVMANVVFHQFGHQAVDRTANGRKALEDVSTGFVLIQGFENTFELADYLLGAVNEIELFSRGM